MSGQRRRHTQLVLVALGVGGIIITATAATVWITDRTAGELTRDVRTLAVEAGAQLPFLSSIVSQLNVMVWTAASALALLVGAWRPSQRSWLVSFGALLFVFAADDALTLHEAASSRFEVAAYAMYAIFGAVLLVWAVRTQGRDSVATFAIGGVLLVASAIVDQASMGQYLLEDGLKLLGALVWLTVPLISLDG